MFEDVGRRKIWERWEFWALIAIVFLLVFFRGKWGQVVWDKAEFYSFLIFVFVTWSSLGVVGLKHHSPKVVWNDGNDSTDGHYDVVGNYAVIPAGVVDAWEIHSKVFHDKTLIFPLTAINKVGKNIVITCRMEPVPFERLPYDVQRLIVTRGYKAPYYFGLLDEEQELNNPKAAELEEQVKTQNELITFLIRYIKNMGATVEEVVSQARRITETARGGLEETLKKLFKEEGE